MTDFQSQLLRLKEQLNVATDREVAALFGLSDQGLNSRKARGAFPEDKLYALAAKRPELGLDVPYILSGERSSVEDGGPAGTFTACLLRLKESLAIAADKDVAELLGMSPPAFHHRKARGAFPVDKLYALAAKRPDLRLDAGYVLTGERTPGLLQGASQEQAFDKLQEQIDAWTARLAMPLPFPNQAMAAVGAAVEAAARAGLVLSRQQCIALVNRCYGAPKA